ncbi:MAG: ROK family protein [Candidatus Angelobacter sp.]
MRISAGVGSRVFVVVTSMKSFENNPAKECILGVDLGATSLRVARVDADGGVFLSVSTPLSTEAEQIVSSAIATARESMKVSCLGLSRAPDVDDHGRVGAWPSRPQWRGLPLIPWLWASSEAPVFSADDGVCATLWEHYSRVNAPRNAVTACIGIGTGVSVGIITNDGVVPSGEGAETLSHGRLPGMDLPCKCGQRGCLQTLLCVQSLEQLNAAGRVNDVRRGFHEFLMILKRRYNVDLAIITGGGVDRFGPDFLKDTLTASALDAGIHLGVSLTPGLSGVGGALLLATGHPAVKNDTWLGRIRRFIYQTNRDMKTPELELCALAKA